MSDSTDDNTRTFSLDPDTCTNDLIMQLVGACNKAGVSVKDFSTGSDDSDPATLTVGPSGDDEDGEISDDEASALLGLLQAIDPKAQEVPAETE